MNKHIFFVDVETTGFSPLNNDVIQLAYIVTDHVGNKLDEFMEYCRPDNPSKWSEKAEEIHGITLAEALSHQPQKDLCKKILQRLEPFRDNRGYPLIYGYHGLYGFDAKFVESMFVKQELQFDYYKFLGLDKRLSTVTMAKALSDYLSSVENNKLNTLANYFGIELNHHDALSDIRATVEIYKRLLKIGVEGLVWNHQDLEQIMQLEHTKKRSATN